MDPQTMILLLMLWLGLLAIFVFDMVFKPGRRKGSE